jgi:uncharacterized membrane protein (UPF0136 family)
VSAREDGYFRRMLDVTKTYYFIFGAFTVIGGIMGYMKAKSTASLVAGGVSGALLIIAGWLLATQPESPAGLIVGVIVSAALAGRFVPNYLTKKVLFPGGVMALLSIASIVLTILAFKK